MRIPAAEIEALVLQAVERLLTDEANLVSLMEGNPAERRRHLHEANLIATQLSEGTSQDKIRILQRLVKEIVAGKTSIKIVIYLKGLWTPNYVAQPDDPVTTLERPIRLKRCGMAVRLIVPSSDTKRQPDPKLIALIARGHRWFAKLTSGECTSIREIANQEHKGASYVTRVINLAFLDPGIVSRILEGTHPLELNADRLIRSVPLPERWDEQRRLLGFDSN